VSPVPGAELTGVRRVGRLGLAWRLAALAAVVGLAGYGTGFGDDDMWPFAPMSQFAFRVDRDSEIRAVRVDALTTGGAEIRVSLSPAGIGMARAEIEGQLPRIVEDPSLLQNLALAQRRRHPGQPQFRRIYLREQVTTLRDGRAVGEHVETLATWDVPDAP
jgi:hypothetical protein